MKALYNTQNTAPGRRFDNPAISLIVHWMHPLRLKAFRGFAASAALFVATAGCETDGETVPVRTAGIPSAAASPRPVQLAYAEPPKTETASAAAEVSTNDAAATPEVTTNTPTTVTVTNVATTAATTNETASATSTNDAPVITEEIPPARPANLKITESTDKVIKLVESSLDEKVVLTFVQQTPTKFELDADEIVYLSDLGVPSTVIAAMLKHDGDDPSKAETLTAAPDTENIQPALPANTNFPPAIAQTQPEPQQIEVTTNYVPNPNQQVVVQQQPQTVVVQQPQTVVYAQPETVTYFYDSLSPYGSWYYVNDYGWCWQPTVAVVDQGWRPYGPRGNWVWTDAGWYWRSDYTWGWAPFHYGRWHHHGGRGWLWVPDRVWGPAWVSWRSYGDYCGWAPLPPHAVYRPGFGFSYFGRGVDVSFGFGLGYDAFCFAPVGRFHHRRVYDYCLPRHEVHRVFPHSRVANRFEYRRDGRGRDDHFVNRNNFERTERGIQPTVVRSMSEADRSRYGNRERETRSGSQNVIYTPAPPPSAVSAASSIVPNRNPRTDSRPFQSGARPGVTTRPSTTASGIAATAPQPVAVDRAGRERPTREALVSRTQVASRPSSLSGRPAPMAAPQPQAADPSTRTPMRSPITSRQVTGTPAPVTSTPSPITSMPSPTRGAPSPITSMPSPVTGPRPQISNTPTPAPSESPRVIPRPQINNSPTPVRPTTPAPTPRSIDPATRRSFGDSTPQVSPRVTPLPGSPTADSAPRSITAAEPAPSRRDFGRPNTPAITSAAPSPITPQISSRPMISTPPPTRVTPSAPTYSAPQYTPPVRGNVTPLPAPINRAPAMSSPAPVNRAPAYSAPVSRPQISQSPISRSEPRSAPAPSTVSPDRGRRGGRD
ncbi:MAG TPA: DUF6600 domain-containing protein [Verrucomicrobiae bacterium]|nr:DUF6600 domain-containing protein [Verrucomicrobiae bacterium]